MAMVRGSTSDVNPWRGLRHARVLREMFDLPGQDFRVYIALRLEMLDGERIGFQIRDIADVAGCSPGTVQPALHRLHAEGWIRLDKLDDRSLVITMLSPFARKVVPKRAEAADSAEPAPRPPRQRGRSTPDRASSTPAASQAGRSAPNARSRSPADRHEDHDHDQHEQQQPAASAISTFSSEQQAFLRELCKYRTVRADIAERVVRVNPEATIAEFAQDLRAAESRPRVHNPLGLTLFSWARGERVQASRARPEASSSLDQRGTHPVRSGAKPARKRAKSAEPLLAAPDGAQLQAIADREAHVRERITAIAPPDISNDQRATLTFLLLDGVAETDALAQIGMEVQR